MLTENTSNDPMSFGTHPMSVGTDPKKMGQKNIEKRKAFAP